MRRIVSYLVPLSASLALALALGCDKNEAIVCSSDDGAAGTSCAAKYNLCSGAVYDLKCSPKTADTVECQCVENGVEKSRFTSDDACKVSPGSRRQRARDGCKWTLD